MCVDVSGGIYSRTQHIIHRRTCLYLKYVCICTVYVCIYIYTRPILIPHCGKGTSFSKLFLGRGCSPECLLCFTIPLCHMNTGYLHRLNFEKGQHLSPVSVLCTTFFARGVAKLQFDEDVQELPAADLVAGCDGVNSVARRLIGEKRWYIYIHVFLNFGFWMRFLLGEVT